MHRAKPIRVVASTMVFSLTVAACGIGEEPVDTDGDDSAVDMIPTDSDRKGFFRLQEGTELPPSTSPAVFEAADLSDPTTGSSETPTLYLYNASSVDVCLWSIVYDGHPPLAHPDMIIDTEGGNSTYDELVGPSLPNAVQPPGFRAKVLPTGRYGTIPNLATTIDIGSFYVARCPDDGSGFSGLLEDIELRAAISVDRRQPHIVYTVKEFRP